MKKLGEWKSSGLSWTGIQKKLQVDHNIQASNTAIQNAYSTYATRSAEIIAGDDSLKNNLKVTILNTTDQLQRINDLVWSMLQEEQKKTISNKDKLAAIREIREQLTFQESILNRLSNAINPQQINLIEYNKFSTNNLEELEKLGYIKILKRPGQTFKKIKEYDEPTVEGELEIEEQDFDVDDIEEK